jgi:hypothetical protein
VFVLVSDLYEGEGSAEMIRRLGALSNAGSAVIVLLALDDEGKPSYEKENAASLAALGIPCFACTPDAFPDLMAVAVSRGDVAQWAASRESAAATLRT